MTSRSGGYKQYLRNPRLAVPRQTRLRWQRQDANQVFHPLGEENIALHAESENESENDDGFGDPPEPMLGDDIDRPDVQVDERPMDGVQHRQPPAIVVDGHQNGQPQPAANIFDGSEVTKAVLLQLVMAYVLRHNITGVALTNLLWLLNIMVPNSIENTKYLFMKNFEHIAGKWERHYYCEKCQKYFGKISREFEGDTFVCETENCGAEFCAKKANKNGNFFAYIPIQYLLKDLLENHEVQELLIDKTTRVPSGSLEDIFDGSIIKDLIRSGTLGKEDLTAVWNVDGVEVYKQSPFSMTPMQFVINELPFSIRKDHTLICGLWFGPEKPNMDVFLEPFIKEAQKLAEDGFVWTDMDGGRRHSHVYFLLGAVDTVARPTLNNLTQFNGEYGCNICYHPGKIIPRGDGHSRVYRYTDTAPNQRTSTTWKNDILRAEGLLRAEGHNDDMRAEGHNDDMRDEGHGDDMRDEGHDDDMRDEGHDDDMRDEGHDDDMRDEGHGDDMRDEGHGDDMRDEGHGDDMRAERHGGEDDTCNSSHGVKGSSSLMDLPLFDIVWGLPPDYMHCVLIGVVKQITHKFFQTSNNGRDYYIGDRINEVDRRMASLHVVKEITRNPQVVSKRRFWKASEYKNWLLYYSPCVLRNILDNRYFKHWLLLVFAIHVLLSPVITPADLVDAEYALSKYVYQIQVLYDIGEMKMNVHLLTHLIDAVKRWGPLWAFSAFSFESNNHYLRNMKLGTRYVPEQIVKKFLLWRGMPKRLRDVCGDASDAALSYLQELLSYRLTKRAVRVGNLVLFGSVRYGQLDEEEWPAVNRLTGQIEINNVQSYQRMYCNGRIYTVKSYRENSDLKRHDYIAQLSDCKTVIILQKILLVEETQLVIVIGDEVNLTNRCFFTDQAFRSDKFIREVSSLNGGKIVCEASQLNDKCILVECDDGIFVVYVSSIHDSD